MNHLDKLKAVFDEIGILYTENFDGIKTTNITVEEVSNSMWNGYSEFCFSILFVDGELKSYGAFE